MHCEGKVALRKRRGSTRALTAGVLAALVLSGCSASPSFEEQTQDRARSSDTFKLPSKITGGASWKELLIMCPGDKAPKGVNLSMAKVASKINTTSTDSSQWLVFRTGTRAVTVTLARSAIDFCAGPPPGSEVYTPNTRWVGTDQDGVTALRPVE
jgi:hypothetical protein